MGRHARIAVFAVCSGLLLSGPAAAAGPVAASAACTGTMLRGTFRVVRGSAGAGQITYELLLRNRSAHTCFVTGIPRLKLLDAHGRPLPTHAVFGGPRGLGTAVIVPLAPGRSAKLTARFSPDVPGPGEPVLKRACERTATRLRVRPSGGGKLVAPVLPHTPVCEHGAMTVSLLTAAKS